MLLYLCSNQNINSFDYIEKDTPIKKMAGSFRLKQFVIHDIRNLNQFSHFVIDIKALRDTPEEIADAVSAFRTLYNSRVIILAEGLDEGNILIQKLIDMGVYNLITSTEYEDIKKEMDECMSVHGKSAENAVWKTPEIVTDNLAKGIKTGEGHRFLCKDIKIAVVGSERKVGTTTIAFQLANFLVNNGASAAYVEANKRGHLQSIAQYYMFASGNIRSEYKGVKYYYQGNYPEGNNFVVFDFGAMPECKIHMVKQCDIIVLSGGGRPYEVEQVQGALTQFEGTDVFVVLSHVPDGERGKVGKFFKNTGRIIMFAEYAPVLFDGITNEAIFKELIKDYINLGDEKHRGGD